ncbi:MAG: hypothetical protein K8F56_07890 [Rhodocyclaceae bacterium]|nr:hypothetical protein [Rhodocyclaceae bacterium]
MRDSNLTKHRLFARFLEALRELPDVKADLSLQEPLSPRGDWRHDARVELRVAGKTLVLLVDAKKSVFPRDAREAIGGCFRRSESEGLGDTSLPLLVAESISTGAKDLLRSESIGYFDSGGSLYLPAPGAYIYIDRPPPKSLVKSVRGLFTPRRTQVLYVLLMQHQDWFGITELAAQAMVSPATASQVMSALERFDWLEVRGQGPSKQRHLREPAALLDAWAQQVVALGPPALRRYYVPGTAPEALAARLGKVFDGSDVAYAITHETAAQHYAPFLSGISQVRVRVRVGANVDIAIRDLDARVASEGANLAVLEVDSPGELLLRERVDNLWMASSIQIYLDLLRGEGRSKEMAEHFRTERIRF